MTTTPTIQYELSAPNPRSHYFHVRAHFFGSLGCNFRIALPVWTPGSYLIREYAKNLINLQATSDNRPVEVTRIDKAAWGIEVPQGADSVTVDYDVYAYELTVRSSYLDGDYGITSPASSFVYHPEWKGHRCSVQVTAPEGWEIATGMPVGDEPNQFWTADYDALVDSPIQMGHLVRHSFVVDSVPHHLVVAGPGAAVLPHPDFLKDLTRIIEAARDIFGSLPYRDYHFLVTLSEKGGGGLEHLNSANIMVPISRWQSVKDYPLLLSLFAHEYFHLWNVKRLRPTVLGPFDYQSEAYTSLLWALEGITNYFAQWLLAKSGVVPAEKVLGHFAEALKNYEKLPGRWVTPTAAASREAWIREYRQDANTPNITVSYYLKGELVGLFLDLELNRQFQGKVTLPRVMQELWTQYQDRGYPEPAFEDLLVEMGGPAIAQYLQNYVHGVAAFDESVLDYVGLQLERLFKDAEGERPAWLGLVEIERQGRLYARVVERGGPAEMAGVSPDDEILAANNLRIASADEWKRVLTQVDADQMVSLTLAHQGVLQTADVEAEAPRPDDYRLTSVPEPTEAQRTAFEQWLGVPLQREE